MGSQDIEAVVRVSAAAADSLSYEEFVCEKGRDNLVKALEEHFAPHLESSLPRAFEAVIYGEPVVDLG